MLNKHKILLDETNKNALLINIQKLMYAFSIELVPGFKLRNTNPENFFDIFIGRYVAYLLLSNGKMVKNFAYNSYWLENKDFTDMMKERNIDIQNLDNVHVEYWFKSGEWENDEKKPHYHKDVDGYRKCLKNNNVDLDNMNEPLLTSIICLSDHKVPTMLFNDNNYEIELFFPQELNCIHFDGANLLHGHFHNLYDDINIRSLIVLNIFTEDVKYSPYLDINQMYQWFYMKTGEIPTELPVDVKFDIKNINDEKEIQNICINSTEQECQEFKQALIENNTEEVIYKKYISRILSEINNHSQDKKHYKISINKTTGWVLYDNGKETNLSEENSPDDFNAYANIYKNVFKERILMSKECCKLLIHDANNQVKKHSGTWVNNRHIRYPTYDISIDKLSPSVLEYILLFFTEKLAPLVLDNFNINPHFYALNIRDAFIVKYDENTQQSLELHTDESDLSVIITLSENEEYSGGGTRFETGLEVHSGIGDAIIFGSRYKHEGLKIDSGVRMLLVFFIDVIRTVD